MFFVSPLKEIRTRRLIKPYLDLSEDTLVIKAVFKSIICSNTQPIPKLKHPMPKPPPRLLQVQSREKLSENLLRFTMTGDALADFPLDQESGYVKLMFAADGSPLREADENIRPLTRSYTVRAFDQASKELVLDFVCHGDNGPASAWAMKASVGDEILVGGPGAKKLVDFTADWFFIAGDLTALPAISVNLEQLPHNAKGYAVIEAIHESDTINMNLPAGIDVHWVMNPTPEKPNSKLADAVKALPWLEDDGRVNVWVACEFESMRSLRRYFKQERKVDRRDIYASSYWKIGDTDEGNKAAKSSDPEAN